MSKGKERVALRCAPTLIPLKELGDDKRN